MILSYFHADVCEAGCPLPPRSGVALVRSNDAVNKACFDTMVITANGYLLRRTSINFVHHLSIHLHTVICI